MIIHRADGHADEHDFSRLIHEVVLDVTGHVWKKWTVP
jgi:hypothetical protein